MLFCVVVVYLLSSGCMRTLQFLYFKFFFCKICDLFIMLESKNFPKKIEKIFYFQKTEHDLVVYTETLI